MALRELPLWAKCSAQTTPRVQGLDAPLFEGAPSLLKLLQKLTSSLSQDSELSQLLREPKLPKLCPELQMPQREHLQARRVPLGASPITHQPLSAASKPIQRFVSRCVLKLPAHKFCISFSPSISGGMLPRMRAAWKRNVHESAGNSFKSQPLSESDSVFVRPAASSSRQRRPLKPSS